MRRASWTPGWMSPLAWKDILGSVSSPLTMPTQPLAEAYLLHHQVRPGRKRKNVLEATDYWSGPGQCHQWEWPEQEPDGKLCPQSVPRTKNSWKTGTWPGLAQLFANFASQCQALCPAPSCNGYLGPLLSIVWGLAEEAWSQTPVLRASFFSQSSDAL